MSKPAVTGPREVRQAILRSRISRGASASFAVLVLGQAASLCLFVFLARILPGASYGAFSLAITWLNVGALFCSLGFAPALTRFTAAYLATAKHALLTGLLKRSSQLAFGVSFATTLGTLLALEVNKEAIQPEALSVFRIGACALPLVTLTNLRSGTIRGLAQPAAALLPDRIIRPITVLAGVIFFFWAGWTTTAEDVMWLYVTGSLIGFVISAYLVRVRLPSERHKYRAEYETREWLKTATGLLLTSGGFLLATQADTMLVGAFLGAEEAGVYFSASRIAALVQFGVLAIQQIAAPLISGLHARGEKQRLQQVLSFAWMGSAGFAVSASGALALFSEQALSLFGPEFTGGETVLFIILVGQLLNALTGLTGLTMTMTGHQNQAAAIIGTAALMNILLDTILIPVAGINGAAVATTLTTAAWNLPMVYLGWRYLGLKVVPFPWPKPTTATPNRSSSSNSLSSNQ